MRAKRAQGGLRGDPDFTAQVRMSRRTIWCAWGSMRHEDRNGRVRQDVARCSAEDHLAQPALGIRSLDQQVAAKRVRGL